jgi:hypothetical protein
MNKITVVCHKDHLHGYEDFEGKCLLCEMEKLYAEINQITHQLYDYRAAFMRSRDREWVGLTTEEIYACDETSGLPQHEITNADLQAFAYAIEAKLKEKNT